MSADPWATFEPPPEWSAPLTDAELDAWAAEEESDQYQLDAIAGATSDPTDVEAAGTYTG